MITLTALKRRAAVLVTSALVVGAVGTAAAPVASAAPIEVTPGGGLDFGSVVIGDVSAPLAFTFESTGEDPGPDFISVVIDGADVSDFSISANDCPVLGLQPGGTCTVSVVFGPLAQGARGAQLVVNGQTSAPLFLKLHGIGTGPDGGVAWGATEPAGPAYTWTGGGALGRTVQSGTQRLHLAYGTNRIKGAWASDTGKHAGIYYVGSSSGSTWSAPKRLNPSSQHAARLGLAASGARVYVAWVSQTRIVKYSPKAPRVLYVRVNTAHGAPANWKRTVRVTSTSGRVDFPSVAASGNDAFVAWTDSNTGKIKVAASHDRGKSWKTIALGSTSLADSSGRRGLPSVAADGSTVVVAWGGNAFAVRARVSTDRGKTWGPTVTVGPDSIGYASTAVRGDRIAVTWSTGTEVVLRERIAGAWQPTLVVASQHAAASSGVGLQDTIGSLRIYAPAVALQDGGRVAVTWSQESATSGRYDLLWSESDDDGAHWFASQTLGSSDASAARVNDWPSVIWASGDSRYVTWNGWTPDTNSYRQYLRTGAGIPSGPASAAPLMR